MPDSALLPVMEQFYTIQGEGFYTGQAAYFIRIAGCDVGCVWCDVKESWAADKHPLLSIDSLVENIVQHPAEVVVITGGEPAMYDLTNLTSAIKKTGKRTHIETSGVYELKGNWDWVCFSPKKFKTPHPDFPELADELKVIVFNKSDFEWAEKWASLVRPECRLYLQPEWDKREVMQPLIVEFVKQNPKWQVSLQTHKYLGVD
ncbi:MAG: radical SAM protein [Bacteroidetes bacterium]|nr:radical SAM protein [Bacteroidota bacterium]